MDRWLESHDHSRLAGLRGVALPHLEKPMANTPLAFAFDKETCTRCMRCVVVCGYEARALTDEGDMLLDEELCRSCGLCVNVCAPGSLTVVES
jgi:ferredoxin